MSYSSSRSSHTGAIVGTTVVLLILAGISWLWSWYWGPQWVHGLYQFFTWSWVWMLPVLAAIVCIVLAIVLPGGWKALPIVAVVVGAVFTIVNWVHWSYDIDHIYASEVKIVDHRAPDFDQRVPFDVADSSSTRNLGDTTGSAVGVKALADQGKNGLWTSLVQRNGWIAGYESVQVQNLPTYGTAKSTDITTCKFDVVRAGLRLGGGTPSDSLDREIFANTPPNVFFETSDAYAYCDGSTPKVVVPLKQLDGFWYLTWKNYGAAVYDGKTGALSIKTDTGKIPGPVYPQSLAASQREALHALGSFDDSWNHRSGFKDTSSDGDDPNGSNPTELTLREVKTKGTAYVTPLTPPGSSKSVVALSVIDATESGNGKRNTLTVYRYDKADARQANSSIAQKIQTDYSWMPDWASGLKIFEIVPGSNGDWVASIGKTQSIVYRAVVKANGESTLYDENGNEVTRTGAVSPTGGGSQAGAGAVNGDLKKMTSAQLAQLGQAILNELANRGSTSTTTPAPTATPSK